MLLDEVEKAHPDVFNILLQVLEDGRLTDGQGRTVDFKNTVIIMTSNLGSDVIRSLSEDKQYNHIKLAVLEVVGKHFRPEFINRIDEVVFFKPLTVAEIERIVDLMLDEVRKRLSDRNITLEMSEKAKEFVAKNGFDPVYGARPLRRYLQRELETKIGRALIADEIREGATIVVGLDGDKLSVKSKKAGRMVEAA